MKTRTILIMILGVAILLIFGDPIKLFLARVAMIVGVTAFFSVAMVLRCATPVAALVFLWMVFTGRIGNRNP